MDGKADERNSTPRGSALVESAIVLPLYFMIFFSQLLISLFITQQISLIGASFDYLHTVLFSNESVVKAQKEAKHTIDAWPLISAKSVTITPHTPEPIVLPKTPAAPASVPASAPNPQAFPAIGAIRLPILQDVTLSMSFKYNIPFFGEIKGAIENTASDNYIVYNTAQYALPLMTTISATTTDTEQMIYGGYTTAFYPFIAGTNNLFTCDYQTQNPVNLSSVVTLSTANNLAGHISGGPPWNDAMPQTGEPAFQAKFYDYKMVTRKGYDDAGNIITYDTYPFFGPAGAGGGIGGYYYNAKWDTCPPIPVKKPPADYVTTPDTTVPNAVFNGLPAQAGATQETYSLQPINLGFKLATEELEQLTPGANKYPGNPNYKTKFVSADLCDPINNTWTKNASCEAPTPDQTPQPQPLYPNQGATLGGAAQIQVYYAGIAKYLGGSAGWWGDTLLMSALADASSSNAITGICQPV